MTIEAKLKKLREQQKQITEALRTVEAEADTRHRQAIHRSKILLGDAILTMPPSERDALLPMLLGRMTARHQSFIGECLAVGMEATPNPATSQGSQSQS